MLNSEPDLGLRQVKGGHLFCRQTAVGTQIMDDGSQIHLLTRNENKKQPLALEAHCRPQVCAASPIAIRWKFDHGGAKMKMVPGHRPVAALLNCGGNI